MSESPPLSIPAALQKIQVGTGKWSKYMRILVYGEAKGGKSKFLADFPKPILAASGGDEQGIAEYLDPAQGDMCFDITTPDQLTAFIKFGAEHAETRFKSIILDPVTAIWTDFMDHFSDKFGGEIKGSKWREVKAPWKIFMRTLKRGRCHVGMSAWLKETLYEKTEVAPGVEGGLSIKAVEMAQVEAKIPYHVDLIFQVRTKRDSKNRPTPIHEVIYAGGRRPRTVDPKKLYTGLSWNFDERDPKNVWDVIVAPILPAWQDAVAGAVDYIGVDEGGAAEDEGETQQIVDDYLFGSILRVIGEQTDLARYRNEVWPKQIDPHIQKLSPAQKAQVLQAHEAKKQDLIDMAKAK